MVYAMIFVICMAVVGLGCSAVVWVCCLGFAAVLSKLLLLVMPFVFAFYVGFGWFWFGFGFVLLWF